MSQLVARDQTLAIGRHPSIASGHSGRESRMTNVSNVTRRDTFAIGAAALSSVFASVTKAEENPERHGISAFGDLKYPTDFK